MDTEPNESSSQPSSDDGSSTESWMDESKWKYIQDNYGLIMKVAQMWRKIYGKTVPREELESAAVILATKCLKSWDIEKGAFSTYLYKAARHPQRFVITYTDKDTEYNNVASLNWSAAYTGEDADLTLQDQISDEVHVEETAISRIMSEELHAAINRLPPALRQHAYATLEGKVSWQGLSKTVATRRKMLKLLKEELS